MPARVRALWLSLLLIACDDEAPRAVVGLDASVPGEPDEMDAGGVVESDASCVDSVGQQDFDGDNFSRLRGDCDDCNAEIGPAALDFPGNGIDEDCSGADAVAPLASCDGELDDDDLTAEDVVRALGLCGETVSTRSGAWGLISAAYTPLDGSEQLHDTRQVWTPTRFGAITPREGSRLLAMSTGVARDAEHEAYTEGCDVFGGAADASGAWPSGQQPPPGFPRDSSECGGAPVSSDALAYDDVSLSLELRAPTNAVAFSFDSMFLTYEYPDFVCSRYNDFFVVLMDRAPRGYRDDGNILLDANEDPIGVNSGLLDVCARSDRAARDVACEQGSALLQGTGFGERESTCAPSDAARPNIGGAATGWLRTEIPVEPGRVFRLRFLLWDSGDPLLDSTVLLDGFRFLERPAMQGTRPLEGLSSF